MTKTQRIAQMTNEINRCAKIAGLPYSKFSKVARVISTQWPHRTMQDLAEDIDCLFDNPDIANLKEYEPKEIASLVSDLWEATR